MKELIAMCLLILFLIGCSSIDQNKAEWIAKNFVKERVKFFATEENEKQDLPQYEISSITSYEQGRVWTVVLHIESTVDNEIKDNDLTVKVNGKGEVIEFNGRKVE